eukprot:gene7375-1903_t
MPQRRIAPPAARRVTPLRAERCGDSAKTGITDRNDRPLSCAQLAPYCRHPEYGSRVNAACRATCGDAA